MAAESWSIVADYVECCNCDYGCPCNFSGYPTDGICEVLALYSIRSGRWGDVPLGGFDVVYVAAWPNAIHEGNGTFQLYVDERADVKQREGIARIFGGHAGGSGPFTTFRSTFTRVFEPQFVKIERKVDGRKSWFKVPGVLDVAVAPFLNPVDASEQDVRLELPKGFIWKWAEACKTTIMKILEPHLSFDHAGRNAFYSVVEFRGP
jgi:hypothetical protein